MMEMPKNEITYPVGERINYFRSLKHISVNKLANMAGISQSYLRDIELGNKNPTIEILSLLCRALEISLSDFFNDEQSTKIFEDPLVERIYQLNGEQKEALLAFLETIV